MSSGVATPLMSARRYSVLRDCTCSSEHGLNCGALSAASSAVAAALCAAHPQIGVAKAYINAFDAIWDRTRMRLILIPLAQPVCSLANTPAPACVTAMIWGSR
jgi:hypothetical protein